MGRSCASSDPTCPVARAISVLQEKWVLHIVHTLLDGPRGFNELGREVGGCNPTTLTQRLARLEQLGLVMRTQDPDGNGNGRSVYALTPAGEGLSDVIEAIHAWSLFHLHASERPHAPVVRLRPSTSGDESGAEAMSPGAISASSISAG